MSTLRLHNLRNLVLILGLGSGATARAEHVDWSQYLEPPGAKPMPVKPTKLPASLAAQPAAKKSSVQKPPKRPAAPAKAKQGPAARKPHR